MSTSAIEERKSEVKEREEKKMNESSQFWKRYVEKVESSVENSVDEEEKSEKMDTSIERISPLEIESNSLLDWTFEEQFKQLYELDDDPERKTFLDDYFEFMRKRGTPVNRIPIMAKQILDLHQLYRLVVQHGGLVQVIKNKQWSKITRGLNLPASITSAAFTLRTQYLKYLYTYECVMHGFSTPKELQAAIDNNKRDRFSTFYPSQPTMTFTGDGRYPTVSTFSALPRPTPTHSLYRGMTMSMKRRADVLDSRIIDKNGPESPKVVILRNGSPVLVNSDILGKRSPSGPRQSHFDPRSGRCSPPIHDNEAKRAYQLTYSRGDWDGDIRQMIQSDHKEEYAYIRDKRDHEHARSKYPYADVRELSRGRKVPCPCSYCLSEQSNIRSQSPSLKQSPSLREAQLVRETAQMTSPVKREASSSSPDDLVIEEKMEKESSDSSSGFEELSPNGQSGSESDRPESNRAKKITDINMRLASEDDAAVGVVRISIEINGVIYKGELESVSTSRDDSKVV
ncbi:uncharacterized protein LOC135687237 [Rhopilema esculentum]|uniref:uncharacterized protein LOC135687237 n=1 Tax=Rhopilema esculentum TaxID=499914 RepID=UPI0031D86229